MLAHSPSGWLPDLALENFVIGKPRVMKRLEVSIAYPIRRFANRSQIAVQRDAPRPGRRRAHVGNGKLARDKGVHRQDHLVGRPMSSACNASESASVPVPMPMQLSTSQNSGEGASVLLRL